jgi:outer membrane protein
MSFRTISALAAGAVLATAQLTSAQIHMSLDDTIAEALAAGPGLKAVGSSAEAAHREAEAAGRQRWGALDAVASYQLLQDDVVVRPISAQLLAGGIANLPFDNQQWHWGVVAEVPLYVGGKLSNGIKISELSAEKSALVLEGSRWQVRFNVTSLYSAAQSLDAIDAALGSRLSALEATSSRLDLMVSEGKRPEIDRLKAVEELESVRATRAAAQASRRKVGALLLSLIGRDPAAGIEVDPLPGTPPELTTPPAVLRSELDETSSVCEARLSVEQTESGVKIATSEFIPKVVARGNYLVNSGQSLDRSYDTWALSLGVIVPLVHGGARALNRAAAKEHRNAAEHRLEKVRLDTAADLEDALAELDAARTSIQAAEARVAVGVEAARIEQIRYDAGAGTIEDLLRALARQEGARSDLARARAESVTAGARINSIVEKRVVQ